MIIIGHHRKLGAVMKRIDVDFMYFDTVADFHRWCRHRPRGDAGDLSAFVDELLAMAQRPKQKLSNELELSLAWLRREQLVPPLKLFAEVVCRRRTFFRKWRAGLNISPSDFLERLRTMYARALLSKGYATHDVVRLTGVGSSAALQRLLR